MWEFNLDKLILKMSTSIILCLSSLNNHQGAPNISYNHQGASNIFYNLQGPATSIILFLSSLNNHQGAPNIYNYMIIYIYHHFEFLSEYSMIMNRYQFYYHCIDYKLNCILGYNYYHYTSDCSSFSFTLIISSIYSNENFFMY